MWRSDTKATPANVRKRITSAIDTVDAAMDLAKRMAREKNEPEPSFQRRIRKLDQARAWLVDANRSYTR